MPLIPIPRGTLDGGKLLLDRDGKVRLSTNGAQIESAEDIDWSACCCCTCGIDVRIATVTFTGITFAAGCNAYAADYLAPGAVRYVEHTAGDPNGTYALTLDTPSCQQYGDVAAAYSVKAGDSTLGDTTCANGPYSQDMRIWLYRSTVDGNVYLIATTPDENTAAFFGLVLFDGNCDATATDSAPLGRLDTTGIGSPLGSNNYIKIATGGSATITLA